MSVYHLDCRYCGEPVHPFGNAAFGPIDPNSLVDDVCGDCRLLSERERAEKQMKRFIRSLPREQEYRIEEHSPPLHGWRYFTVQLVGPPAMDGEEFLGWDYVYGR